MSDRVVHMIEVVADDAISRRSPNQLAQPMRYIATVNRYNNIVHGAPRPEDQLDQGLPVRGETRRYIELDVEEDSEENGPAIRPSKYTATVNEFDIIVHGAARVDHRIGTSSSPSNHVASPPRSLSRDIPQAQVSSISNNENSDSDASAEILVNARRHGGTRGVAERVKTAKAYINRRQKTAISRPGPDAEGKYTVESLLAQIRNPDDEHDPKMLVKWEGYGLEEATYELRSALLEDAPAEVRKFDARQTRMSDERSSSPLNPQPWPKGLSETAFQDLDVAAPNTAASPPAASHSAVDSIEDTDREDDDAPNRRRHSLPTATSSQRRSPLQPKSAVLRRTREQSIDSLFDGPTPDSSFWTASPEPRTMAPTSFVGSNRETSGMFVTPGPEPTSSPRRIVNLPAQQPARARLGEGYSVPEGTRTNKPENRARTDGLGFARSNSSVEAASFTLTPSLNSSTTAFQPDHRILPLANKRKYARPARPISPKRPKFHTPDN
jgi:hypothetical protein